MDLYDVDPSQFIPDPLSSPCGHCGRSGWFRRLAAAWAGALVYGHVGQDRRPIISAIYQCAGCERASLFSYQTYQVGGAWQASLIDRFPTAAAGHNHDLPEEIERDRREAVSCFLAEQHRASVLMARSALQRAVRTLGPDLKGTLYDEINELCEKRIITEVLRDNAHEVRLTGNDVAHPERMGGVSRTDAGESLRFLDDFLQTTIVLPELRRRRTENRHSDRKDKP